MKAGLPCLTVVLGLLCAGGTGRAESHVWTVAETTRVLRETPPGTNRAVRLAAARNEWESFQVLVRSDTPLAGVSLEPGALRGPDGAALGTDRMRLYRQHQLHLTNGTYRNDRFQPGWYPDPLIPFEHPLPGRKLNGARLTAVPFDLPPGETQGFWVDLYVPPDAQAGRYRGAFRVTAADRQVEVPVELTVWNFALPRVPALQTAFGSPADRMRDHYRQRAKDGQEPEPQDWKTVETQCAQLLADHRVNATPPRELLRPAARPDGSYRIPSEQVRALREFVDRYHVNALQTPHPSSVIKDPAADREKLRAWLAAFDLAARELDRPGLVFFTYLKDEPNTEEDYRYVQTWGRAVRDAGSVVKVLVVEQPWTEPGKGGADSAWGELFGAVDIWCPLFSLHRPEEAARRLALGETVWTYTALCQGPPTPWWHMDYPLLNYRVPSWMAWRDRLRGLLYWGGMSYWRQTDDPWTQAPFYTGSGRPQQGAKGIVFYGEGSLVYPARAVGHDGIVPTLRLKALRDGIEDYEFLALLERLGARDGAAAVVQRRVESFFKWEKDPAAYEAARRELAELILAAQPAAARGSPSPKSCSRPGPRAGRT
jgi:hypothetical protein